jgi:uncharacterized membrane protein
VEREWAALPKTVPKNSQGRSRVGLILVLVGAALGAALLHGVGGALVGGLLGGLIERSIRQQAEIAALVQQLRELRLLRPAPPDGPGFSQAPPTAPLPAFGPQVPMDAQTQTPSPLPVSLPSPAPGAMRAPLPRPAFEPAPTPEGLWWARLQALRDRWLGGNLVAQAGVVILFVGLAFLARYASEHARVPVELRLAGIGVVALVLLALGWRLRLRLPGYAQVLQGGAIAVLYLTLFVAFRFYGVLASGPVFALMAVVAALAAALAVLQDARALAQIGALGGFATPLLVSSGGGNQVALFACYLVLDLGIAAVAWHKTWRALNLVGFFFSYGVGAAWGLTRYRSEQFLSSECFLVACFFVFNAILLMPARRAGAADAAGVGWRADAWVNGSLLFGVPTASFLLQQGLVRDLPYGSAFSALALAGFYLLLAWALRARPRLAVTFEASLAIALVFLTLVIPLALDARGTAGAWALEAAGVVWLGCRQQRRLARCFGYALFLLAALALGLGMGIEGLGQAPPTTVFNAEFLDALLMAAASLVAAWFVHRADYSRTEGSAEAWAEPVLIAWATLWFALAAAGQIGRFVDPAYRLSSTLLALSGVALLYTGLSARLNWPRVALPVLAQAPLLALGLLGSALALANPASGGGVWAWPVALAVHVLALHLAACHWPLAGRQAVHALGVLLLAGLGALQGRAITADWGDAASAWPWLGWLVVPALLLMGLARPASAGLWPVRLLAGAYRGTAAAVLAVGLWLWTLLANVGSTGSALPLIYLPLLNPLDLGVAAALVAATAWWRSDAARFPPFDSASLRGAALGTAAFVWLNAMVLRGFFQYAEVPFRADAWMATPAVQTGLSLLWASAALALMWFSARRAARAAWLTGAGLLAAVVLKLLLVDLSGSTSVTRIVSFIGVGLLMLVIGYVAPMPSRESRLATDPTP